MYSAYCVLEFLLTFRVLCMPGFKSKTISRREPSLHRTRLTSAALEESSEQVLSLCHVVSETDRVVSNHHGFRWQSTI